MHSDAFARTLCPLLTGTFMGQTRSHLPQDMHFALSTRTRNSANRLIGFKNTVTGQIYLQNALLSRQIYANAMPTA